MRDLGTISQEGNKAYLPGRGASYLSLVSASACTLAVRWGWIFQPEWLTVVKGGLVPLTSSPPRVHKSNLSMRPAPGTGPGLLGLPQGRSYEQCLAADLELA